VAPGGGRGAAPERVVHVWLPEGVRDRAAPAAAAAPAAGEARRAEPRRTGWWLHGWLQAYASSLPC
jgi:hypothetical protein